MKVVEILLFSLISIIISLYIFNNVITFTEIEKKIDSNNIIRKEPVKKAKKMIKRLNGNDLNKTDDLKYIKEVDKKKIVDLLMTSGKKVVTEKCDSKFYAIIELDGKLNAFNVDIPYKRTPPTEILRDISEKYFINVNDRKISECLSKQKEFNDKNYLEILKNININGKSYKIQKWVCGDNCFKEKENELYKEVTDLLNKSIDTQKKEVQKSNKITNVKNVDSKNDKTKDIRSKYKYTWWIYLGIYLCLNLQVFFFLINFYRLCFKKDDGFYDIMRNFSDTIINIPPTFGILGTIVSLAIAITSKGTIVNSTMLMQVFTGNFKVAVNTTLIGGVVYAINLTTSSIMDSIYEKVNK